MTRAAIRPRVIHFVVSVVWLDDGRYGRVDFESLGEQRAPELLGRAYAAVQAVAGDAAAFRCDPIERGESPERRRR